jgi:tartrate dehydratase beta subunit/fumarate hydratase class I family protein
MWLEPNETTATTPADTKHVEDIVARAPTTAKEMHTETPRKRTQTEASLGVAQSAPASLITRATSETTHKRLSL